MEINNDLISRQAAIDALINFFGLSIEEEYGSAIQEVLNGLPSAQPERKNGKWVNRWSGDGSVWLEEICSECGLTFEDEPHGYNYCSNCGAKMEE